MRIKFIVMVLSLLSILRISLIPADSSLSRFEVDLDFHVCDLSLIIVTLRVWFYWSAWPNPGRWLADGVGSVCSSLIILSPVGSLCAMPGRQELVYQYPVYLFSAGNHIIPDNYTNRLCRAQAHALIPLPDLMFSGYQERAEQLGGSW